MKLLESDSVESLERLSPVVYVAIGEAPAFVYNIDPRDGRLVGFFLAKGRGELSPRVLFDTGDGFINVNPLVLQSFPFAFYHISQDRTGHLRRLRIEPGAGEGATFRLLPFQTSNGILVAILHYLFNLRYRKVPLVAGDNKARGRLASWTASIARIVKFFGDVSKGGGMRVQEGAHSMLSMLLLSLVNKTTAIEAEMTMKLSGVRRPLISFVTPTYNTSETFLQDLVDSFTLQKAAYAELILSDDGSPDPAMADRLAVAEQKPGVRVVRNEKNRGIAAATNAGVAAARGRWISFVDHDDVLVSGAIAVIAKAIQDHPDAVFFYTDELIVDAALKPLGEFCKPAYDSVLLSGMNYINHLSIYRADRLAEIGALRKDREGSQAYDLLLRYLAGASPGSIVHIPYLAYLWRREAASYPLVDTECSVDSGRLALAAAYEHEGAPVVVEPAPTDPRLHRVRLPQQTPLVTIVIPNRDSPALIKRIVADIREKTDYPRVEIVIVDNGSVDPAVLALYEAYRRDGIVVDIKPEPFNFAAMCNRGARLGQGEAILFLNNDIEVPSDARGWLAEMVECLGFAATGIVGAKLEYPSGKIQHAGVIAGLGNAAGHWNIEAPTDTPGPMGRLFVRQTLSAVTGACMLVSRPCFETLGGFDEESFAVAYNDIDFCLRARAAGIRTVWTPFARLIHHESLTRGSDENGAQYERFKREMTYLQRRHSTNGLIDDAFSPFYDRRYSNPTILIPETLPCDRQNIF